MAPTAAVAMLLIAAGLLAGCTQPAAVVDSEDDSGVSPDVEPQSGFQPVQTTQSTGGITGVVVDEAIRPVSGAAVQLVQAGQDQRSDDDGLFAFAGLAQGAYTLRVSAAGMLSVTQTVTVQAESATKVKVVLLAADASSAPYHTTYAFRGYMEASAGLATWAVALFANDLANQSLCKCTFFFVTDDQPLDFVFEAVWTETVDDPTDFGFYWEFLTWEDNNVTGDASPSPVYAVIPASNYPPGHTHYKARLTGPWTFPTVQQSYDLYITAFYREHPPEGWSLVQGNT
jgi:hypothetical protein